MESFRHRHDSQPGDEREIETRGLLLDRGWRYDLEVWFFDTFVLRGKMRELRQRVLDLAELREGQALLDVGCGTGTLAIEAAARAGATAQLSGIDPAPRQIARARSKGRRAGVSIDFRVAAIEALPFSEGSFDVVTSTLMTHHLPEDLKSQGLSEIIRVLKPGGRLVAGDFKGSERHDRKSGHQGQDQAGLIRRAGFTSVEVEELRFPRAFHKGWAGAAIVLGRKP